MAERGQGSWIFCSAAVRNSIAPVARLEAVPPWLELRDHVEKLFLDVWSAAGGVARLVVELQ